jgi:hypothetical protein
MKTFNFGKTFLAVIATIGLALATLTVEAQNAPANPAPQLSYGVPQILQLAQAKVGDDTIIAYIHNSGTSYGLDADQIIYLRQQGVSDKVLNTMLTQPKPAYTSTFAATAPPADYSSAAQTPAPAATPEPTTTYVQTVPSSTVYVMPNSQPYYYSAYYNQAYPYYYPYSYYPSVSLSFGWGSSSYHGNYYYYGNGYHGGYPGGGYHGGYPGGGGHPPGGGYPGGGGGHPPSGGGYPGGGHPGGGGMGGGGMHH